jgi:hypothetical protein
VTAETDRPPSLRTVIKGLQADLDEVTRQEQAHISEHKCRPGHDNCRAGNYWHAEVAKAQRALGITRFVNEED